MELAKIVGQPWHSPAVALLTSLPLADATRLTREFGLQINAIEPLSAGSVNSNFALTAQDGRRYFARLYEEQGRDGALAELKLVAALSRAGVPVVQCLPRSDGAGVGEFQGKAFAVFPWLDGEILCQGRVSEDACQKLGAALARMHLTTPSLARPPEGRFRINSQRNVERISPGSRIRIVVALKLFRPVVVQAAMQGKPQCIQMLRHPGINLAHPTELCVNASWERWCHLRKSHA
jgi:hypothetical protein